MFPEAWQERTGSRCQSGVVDDDDNFEFDFDDDDNGNTNGNNGDNNYHDNDNYDEPVVETSIRRRRRIFEKDSDADDAWDTTIVVDEDHYRSVYSLGKMRPLPWMARSLTCMACMVNEAKWNDAK